MRIHRTWKLDEQPQEDFSGEVGDILDLLCGVGGWAVARKDGDSGSGTSGAWSISEIGDSFGRSPEAQVTRCLTAGQGRVRRIGCSRMSAPAAVLSVLFFASRGGFNPVGGGQVLLLKSAGQSVLRCCSVAAAITPWPLWCSGFASFAGVYLTPRTYLRYYRAAVNALRSVVCQAAEGSSKGTA